MVTVLGQGVSIANIESRMKTAHPELYQPTAFGPKMSDVSVYSTAQSIIKANPTWTEDQVYTEVLRRFTPAATGGTQRNIATLQTLQQQRTMNTILVIGGIAVLGVVLWNAMQRKRVA